MGKATLTLTVALLLDVGAAQAVEPVYLEVAQYVGVPPQILYAMSKAESGRLQNGTFGPWPWTLNIAGSAKRYENRQDMFDGLMAALGSGERMIDVGPMQVNWYWQFDRMGSAWRITDPATNIKVAAQILLGHYESFGDWWEAVGRYHRPASGIKNLERAEQYRARVRHFYQQSKSQKSLPDAA